MENLKDSKFYRLMPAKTTSPVLHFKNAIVVTKAAGVKERVHHGGTLCSFVASGKQIVFSAD